MTPSKQYPSAEVERMMRLQDVLLKAMARKITWWEAAEIIGVSDRTMRGWRERLGADSDSGLADRRRGKPSEKRAPLVTLEKVPGLYASGGDQHRRGGKYLSPGALYRRVQ